MENHTGLTRGECNSPLRLFANPNSIAPKIHLRGMHENLGKTLPGRIGSGKSDPTGKKIPSVFRYSILLFLRSWETGWTPAGLASAFFLASYL